jgi:hypothetical protein
MNGLTPRQLTLSIAFPIVIVAFIILGILILRKDKNYWGNRLFALFFWIVAVALGFNLSYLFSTDHLMILILNEVTIFLINGAIIAILFGTLVIYKGEETIIKNNKTYISLIVLAVIILIQIFISYGNGVSVENDPYWSLEFGIYELVFSQFILITVFYCSFLFYRELSKDMKNKFRWFLVGLIFLDITLVSITIDNMNIIPGYGSIGAILNFMVVIGAFLIYLGIVRRN